MSNGGGGLRSVARKLLVGAKLEPAAWLGDERSRGRPVSLKKLGVGASAELVEYAKLAEEGAFRRQVAAILQKGGSFYWGIGPLRAPSTLLFKHTSSEVVAFLMGSSVLGSDPDSGAYLTAAWGLGRQGKSQSVIASFLFNDVAPSDKDFGDFVVEGLSIKACLMAFGETRRRPKKTVPECVELARLYRRGIWIAQLVQEDDLDSLDAIAQAARYASPRAVYAKERRQLESHPHIAAYWLLSHALLGETELLVDALQRTEASKNPVVVDLRKKLARVAKDPTSLAKLFEKHRPEWSKADLAKLGSHRIRVSGSSGHG